MDTAVGGGGLPPYRKFDVVACRACGRKFLNLQPNGMHALCPRCGSRDVALYRRSPGA